jgi:hypothetical protein
MIPTEPGDATAVGLTSNNSTKGSKAKLLNHISLELDAYSIIRIDD